MSQSHKTERNPKSVNHLEFYKKGTWDKGTFMPFVLGFNLMTCRPQSRTWFQVDRLDKSPAKSVS